MLTYIAIFMMGFFSASLCAMFIVCCESERIERKDKDKSKEKKDD